MQLKAAVWLKDQNKTIIYDSIADTFTFKEGYEEQLEGLNFGIIEDEPSEGTDVFDSYYDYCTDREPNFDNIKWLKLFSTYNCNLDCEYCIIKHYEKLQNDTKVKCVLPDMSSIRKALTNFDSIDSILFSGGEPLLVWSQIKKIIDTFPEYYVRINTNGLLLNEEIITHILDRGKVDLHISIDYLPSGLDWRRDVGGGDTQIKLRKKLTDMIAKYPGLKDVVVLNQLIQPGENINFKEVDEFCEDNGISNRSIKVPQHVEYIEGDYNKVPVVREMHDWLTNRQDNQWLIGSKFHPNVENQHMMLSGATAFKSSWEPKIVFMNEDASLSRCPHVYISEEIVKDNVKDISKEMISLGDAGGLDAEKYKEGLISTFDVCNTLYCKKCPIRMYCDMYSDVYSVVCTNSTDKLDLYCVYLTMMFAFNIYKYATMAGEKYIEYLESINKRVGEKHEEYFRRQG